MTDALTRAAIESHREWLGFVQPVGLVVAEPVLVERGVILDRHARPRQERFKQLLDADEQRFTDIRSFFTEFLGWEADHLAEPAAELHVRLPELGVTLGPSFAVADPDGGTQLLIRLEPDDTNLDAPVPERVDGWTAPPQARFERLLRQSEIPTGLLCTPQAVRLVYAPKGETSGHITFRVADMATVMGRPILAALELLLGIYRLSHRAPARERLPALLEASREAQNTVSTKLARLVLGSLYELLRGFVAADARDPEHRLQTLARQRPEDLYGGLVTALMRLVFILYAEDRDLMPQDPVYEQHYGLRGLFARLREDAARHGDLMDRRYGAWARLLALFRLIHKGGGHEGLRFTARKGRLFDPDAYPFLEGRTCPEEEAAGPPPEVRAEFLAGLDDYAKELERALDEHVSSLEYDPKQPRVPKGSSVGGQWCPPGHLPMVPDGTVWRVLERLLVLDGERLSYRTLDVEQIGSVYEVVMGFRIELADGRSLALRTKAKHGAAVVVDLDALLETAPDKRAKALADLEVAKLTDREAQGAKAAGNVHDLADALDRKIDRDASPDIVPAGVPMLQPTDERRRSGSHYTPRSLTQPIVAETLRPILERLGPKATPEQILDLKVLDPAMGSGAFLVETCRQLAEALVRAWEVHGIKPDLPPDEDALLYAKRQIAQRCLYGIDKNAVTAELGKLSLWLATLAKDHEFTFLDHCIRHGDSLVGLSRRQIAAVDWAASPGTPGTFTDYLVRGAIEKAERERERIRAHLDFATEEDLRPLLDRADRYLDDVRLIGDGAVAAFFKGIKPEERKRARTQVAEIVEKGERGWQEALRPIAAELGWGEHPIRPFHYEIELPEVFDRDNPGFDAIVSNPPFSGVTGLAAAARDGFTDWLRTIFPDAGGKCDLCAFFFRRAFSLLRENGVFGLLATNTIAQGDTRRSGLRSIVRQGGTIFRAVRRLRWPGEAAVIVSVVHVHRDGYSGAKALNSREVERISAFLITSEFDDDPIPLACCRGVAFLGSKVQGIGFVFDDTNQKCPKLAAAESLIAEGAPDSAVIRPYIGGEELMSLPSPVFPRYVLDFGSMTLAQAEEYPRALELVRQFVKPERDRKDGALRANWWKFGHRADEMYETIQNFETVLCTARVSNSFGFVFMPNKGVINDKIVVFAFDKFASFSTLQGRLHEIWARTFSSTLKDDLQYTPSDCFETFPLPEGFETDARLEEAGREYYEFRAGLMVDNDEGLTKTYSRFHDPDERSNAVGELRRLHDAMDRAVLDAYGWSDLRPTCEFELEWEDDEDEADGRARRRKKPWRYRWPEEIRDEVLARLLALNKQRAEQERLERGDQKRRRA